MVYKSKSNQSHAQTKNRTKHQTKPRSLTHPLPSKSSRCTSQICIPLPPNHIPKRNLLPVAPPHITPTPTPTRLPHKCILLLAPAISALTLNEQPVAMVRAQTPRVFEEHVCFALVHFAEDDDVVWVLMGILV
jgi:hypothetical protein